MTAIPMNTTRHGLPVLSAAEAAAGGYASITTNIDADSEAEIFASVCRDRNPARACLIRIRAATYQLALKRD